MAKAQIDLMGVGGTELKEILLANAENETIKKHKVDLH